MVQFDIDMPDEEFDRLLNLVDFRLELVRRQGVGDRAMAFHL